MIELFKARLADEGDLRTLLQRAPAPSTNAARRLRSTPTVRKSARTRVTRPREGNGHETGWGARGLLLVLGESPAARRAVAYVGRLLGRHRGFRVCLAYVLPELPSGLLEHGGAGDPQTEERLSASLQAQRRMWIAQQKEGAQSLIDWATNSLRKAGLPSGALETRFCGPVSEAAVADEILQLARVRRCRTVVVGRQQRSWLGYLLNGDLRRELARRAKRIAIWGIG